MHTIREIDFLDLDTLTAEGAVQVVDSRGIAEYEARHVPGAQNVAHTRMLVRKGELPNDKTLAVHCKTGGRAAVASALLARYDYDVVYVNGEFAAWAAREDRTAVV